MTVAFLHIPKTAGTSYTALLVAGLPCPHLVLDLDGPASAAYLAGLDPADLAGYGLVAGHLDFALCRKAPFLRPVTVLRHPVDRLASWYHHVLRSEVPADQPWKRLIEGRGMPLEGFLLHPTILRMHGQALTEQVAGYAFSGEVPPSGAETLAEAKANLATFAHVGLYERLADSVALARAELELAAGAALPRLNVHRLTPPALPEDLRAAAFERLGLDGEFYSWAADLVGGRLDAVGAGAGAT